MTDRDPTPPAMRAEAADWFVRLQDDGADEASWMKFTAWLEQDTRHRIAYAAVEEAWLDLGQADSRRNPATAISGSRRSTSRPAIFAAAGAFAAMAAAILIAPQLAPTRVFETAKGERRVETLADGSRVALNSGSKVAVRFQWGRRQAELLQGQADFDIRHDPDHPFTVAAGDRKIQVLGTEFDVLMAKDALTVTVLRGVVAVSPRNNTVADRVLLTRGKQLHHVSSGDKVLAVDEGEASAWRKGQLIYRDRRLAEVADDLSRYLPTPITVEPRLADYKVTAVLTLGNEETMVDRLEAILPVTAKSTADGIRLEVRATAD